jgi:predicted RNA-binding Zn ribbon-like protein
MSRRSLIVSYDPPMVVRDFDAATSLAIRLVNSFDLYESDPELLPTPAALGIFLRRNRFPINGEPTARELAQVRELRYELRRVFEAKHLKGRAKVINCLLTRAAPQPHAVAEGSSWVIGFEIDDTASLPRRVASVCAIGLADAIARYGGERLKVCDAAPCENVFVDLSKNLVRRHCSRRCANRTSAAAFRARRRFETATR